MFKKICYLVSLLAVTCTRNALSNDRVLQHAGLVSDLGTHFNTKCLLFVDSGLFGTTRDLVGLVKVLSTDGRGLGFVKSEDIGRSTQDAQRKGYRPMYIMLADQHTRNFLHLLHEIPPDAPWLIIFESPQPIVDFFVNLYVPFNAEVLVATVSSESQVHLSEVYQVAEYLPAKTLPFGTWSLSTGLRTPHSSNLFKRRNQFDGINLEVAACNYDPETTLYRNKLGRLRIGGLFGAVWKIIENELNFTSTVLETPNDAFGSFVNDSWTGMIGMLYQKDIQVAVGGFTYDGERMNAVDFLSPIVLSRVALFIRKPDTMRFKWTGFLTPFTPNLWLVIVGSFIVSGVLLTNVFRIGDRHGIESACLSERHDLNLIGSLFCVHGLFCAQGTSSSPRSNSCRLVLLVVGLSAVVVLAAYSGALTSFLAVLQLALPYETIEEYVDDPRFELAMTETGVWLYLHKPQNGLYLKLHLMMTHSGKIYPKDRWIGLKKICTSPTPYGWFGSRLIEKGLLDVLGCEITSVPGNLIIDSLAPIVRKGSPYRELFNQKIASMRTSGVLDHLVLQAWPDRILSGENGLPKVELYHVAPLVGVVVFGVLASVLVVGVELLLNSKRP